jgi:DNA-binding XRE family transcriptional regulator
MTPAEKLAQERGRKPVSNGKYPLPNKLRDIRSAIGLTIDDVAIAVGGITAPALSNYEAGMGIPLIKAMRLASFFGKKIEEIWDSPATCPGDAEE